MKIAENLKAKLEKIKMISLDVDGVMTDGGIYLGSNGSEFKRFHVRDGAGVVYLQRAGIRVIVITGRKSDAVEARCREIKVNDFRQGVKNKQEVVEEYLEKYGIAPEEAAHVGDDLLDLSLLGKIGVFISVADGADEVCDRADFVTEARGGRGAIREIAEIILKAQDKWDGIIEKYLRGERG